LISSGGPRYSLAGSKPQAWPVDREKPTHVGTSGTKALRMRYVGMLQMLYTLINLARISGRLFATLIAREATEDDLPAGSASC
jgi:hypothetical protein